MAASPHVIPDGTHLDVYEQVAIPSASLGAPRRGSSVFFVPEIKSSLLPFCVV